MADEINQQTLLILIRTAAQLEALKASEAEMGKFNDLAKQQVQQSSELSAAGQKYANELKNQTGEAEYFNLRHYEMREIVNHLSREMPELGVVARYALNPWVASLGVLLYGLNKVSEYYKDMAEVIRSRIDVKPLQELIDLVGQDGAVKALMEAREAGQDFVDQLNKIADAQENIKGKTDDAMASIKATIELYKQERAAIAERDLAKVKADEGSGKLTHAQALVEEQKIRERSGNTDRVLAGQMEEKIIKAKQAEREQLQAQLDNAAGPFSRAQHLSNLKENADTTKAAAEAAQKQFDDQQAYMQKYAGHPGYDDTQNNNKLRIARHQKDKADTAAADAAHQYDTAKTADDELSKNLLEAAKELKDLEREIPRLIAEHNTNQDSRKVIGQTQHETGSLNTLSGLESSTEGKDVEHAAHIQAALAAHKQITQQDAFFYQQFLQMMTAGAQNKGDEQAKIIKALELLTSGGVNSDKRITLLERLVSQLEGNIKSLKNPF